MSTLVARARRLAEQSHSSVGQVRKYTGRPYIVHPAAVANIVRSVPHTNEMLAAAWLHDTVEDNELSLSDIRSECGESVAALVEMLTNISTPTDGNRATRKKLDREHLAQASAQAQTVKVADLIDNVCSIARYDPAFSKIYFAEKRLLLDVLIEADAILWREANRIIGGSTGMKDRLV